MDKSAYKFLFDILIPYGTIKADFETKNDKGSFIRVRVIEYMENKFFVLQINGLILELKGV